MSVEVGVFLHHAPASPCWVTGQTRTAARTNHPHLDTGIAPAAPSVILLVAGEQGVASALLQQLRIRRLLLLLLFLLSLLRAAPSSPSGCSHPVTICRRHQSNTPRYRSTSTGKKTPVGMYIARAAQACWENRVVLFFFSFPSSLVVGPSFFA